MDNPTPNDAARPYSDAEIDVRLADLIKNRDLAESHGYKVDNLSAIIAIIRQLRRERDAARAEVEAFRTPTRTGNSQVKTTFERIDADDAAYFAAFGRESEE